MQRTKGGSLSTQMERRTKKKETIVEEYDGNFDMVISTGSTLLDLAISGSRIHGGGLPSGILVEAFGPSQSGKTALLSAIAGNIKMAGGINQFNDPEARLDQEWVRIFGCKIEKENYFRPDTVTELFKNINEFEPVNPKTCNGIMADSLAALSTEMEMEKTEGDKMGMRRAKEFSEALRKTCRIIKKRNLLLVCSNQIRVNADPNAHEKFTTPGGEAVKFYASVRLKFNTPEKVRKEIRFNGKDVKKVIGIKTTIEVVKTVDDPYRKAPLYITYGYGIDDIRANLQFIKDNTKNSIYMVGEEKLSNSMEEAIQMVEDGNLETKLKEEVIELWETIEKKFEIKRKQRYEL